MSESSKENRSSEMADPKYANLPGIDTESPDVYETSDLPEDDQALSKEPEEPSIDGIEKINVNTKEALGKFKQKDLHGENIDFSDAISQTRKTGYYVPKTEYEILEEGSSRLETPQQKLQRLQHEIRELGEEVHRIQENVKQEASSETMSPVNLNKQLEYLQHQLGEIHLEKVLGPDAKVDLSDPQGQLQKRMLTEIDSYKPAEKKGSPKKGAGQDEGGDNIKYEMFYRPEQAQFSKNARLASLEERLERLENVIGQPSDKLNLLTADTNNKSVVGAVAAVNSKLSILDASNIEQVDVRLLSVIQKLNQIGEKKGAQEDVEKQNKITELFDLVKKWNAVSDTLPQIVDKMVALKELHEKALQFSQNLANMEAAQQEISNSLNCHSDMLKQLQGTFAQNSEAIKKNCESIEERLKTLKK